MRLENIKVTFKCGLPINEPDGNGVMYTQEAIRNAYKDIQNRGGLPIEIPNDKGEFVPVGVTQELELIEEDGKMYISGCGLIFHGGTEENVKIDNKIVTSFDITGVGISKN